MMEATNTEGRYTRMARRNDKSVKLRILRYSRIAASHAATIGGYIKRALVYLVKHIPIWGPKAGKWLHNYFYDEVEDKRQERQHTVADITLGILFALSILIGYNS